MRLGNEPQCLDQRRDRLNMKVVRLQRKQQLADDAHLPQPLRRIEPLELALLQQRHKVLEVRVLDVWLRPRPELQVERDGAVRGGVYDSGLARVRGAFTYG